MKKTIALTVAVLGGLLFIGIILMAFRFFIFMSQHQDIGSRVAAHLPVLVNIFIGLGGWAIGKWIYSKMNIRLSGVNSKNRNKLNREVLEDIQKTFMEKINLWFDVDSNQYIEWFNKKVEVTLEYRNREMFSDFYISNKITGKLSTDQYKQDCEAVANELAYKLYSKKLEELENKEDINEKDSYLYKALIDIIEVENLSSYSSSNRN